MKDKLIVFSGAVLSLFSVWAALPVTDGLKLHLDASDATSMTVDETTKEVRNWRTVESGGATFAAPAQMEKDTYRYCNGIPYLTEENGRKAVVFGTTWDGVATNSLMSTLGTETTLTGVKTVIVVTRQHVGDKGAGAIFGEATSTGARFMRDRTVNCAWNTANWTRNRYLNGISGLVAFVDQGGTDEPHVVAATRSDGATVNSLGGAYLWGSSASDPTIVYNRMSLHEIAMYGRELTAEELLLVQQYLMVKWSIGDIAVWSGEGATTDWNDPDNWMNGKVPTPSTTAYLSGATVTASGDCTALNVSGSNVSLTLAGTASLKVGGDVSGVTFAGKGAVTVNGTLHLAGTENVFGALHGIGCATNETATATTVVIDTDGTTHLALPLGGDIALEKRGSGLLTVGNQAYCGVTRIVAGSLRAQASVDYAKYGTVVANIDASRPETLTLGAQNRVERWDSLSANGMYFLSAEEGYKDRRDGYVRGYTYYRTDDQGRPCVRFGRDASGNSATGTLLKASSAMGNRTVIFVNRQLLARNGGTLIGNYIGNDNRIMRKSDGDYSWHDNFKDACWVSGLAGTSFANAGGVDTPHVVVIRRNFGWVPTSEIIGNCWLDNANGNNPVLFDQMDLYEMVVFRENLTDAQIEEISAALVSKWSCVHPPDYGFSVENALPEGTDVEIAAGAALDLMDVNQTVRTLSGDGSVIARGDLAISGGAASVGSLDLQVEGTLALNGGTLGVRGLSGGGEIVSSSVEPVTLVVSNDTTALLQKRISGNISLVKRGSGDLLVGEDQTYSGETRLEGGALRVNLDAKLARYGTIRVGLDASRPETFELGDDNEVVRWDPSAAGAETFDAAAVAFPNANFRTGYPYKLTDASGRPCVRFGYDQSNVFTGSFLQARSTVPCRTIVIVSRQHETRASGGIFGRYNTAASRIARAGDADYSWHQTVTALTPNVNGIPGTYSFADVKCEAPHVYIARTTGETTYNSLGVAYALNGTAVTEAWKVVYGRFDLYEILAFEEVLSDEAVREIAGILMGKWGIAKPEGSEAEIPANTLSPNTTYRVTADATLDFCGMRQALNAIGLAAGDAEAYPCFTVARPYLGVLDLTEIPLTMSDNGKLGTLKQDILRVTAGTVAGPFASVEGAKGNLRYKQDRVCISNAGMLLLFR